MTATPRSGCRTIKGIPFSGRRWITTKASSRKDSSARPTVSSAGSANRGSAGTSRAISFLRKPTRMRLPTLQDSLLVASCFPSHGRTPVAMRRRSRTAVPDVPAGTSDHPFISWYAGLRSLRAARCHGDDIFLDDLGGKRFAIGVDPDATPVIGFLEDDVSALTSIRWTAVAFVREHKGRDWLALSCRDARVSGAQEMNPVPLRLWIPISRGMLAAWDENRPTRVKIDRKSTRLNSSHYCASRLPSSA